MNYKYRVGDKVRVRSDLLFDSYNGTCVTYDMLKYRGKEMTISSQVTHSRNAAYHFCGDEHNWFWTEDMLEPVGEPVHKRYQPTDTIVITTDGHETRGYHKRNGKVIAESKCVRNEADEHDFHVAANLVVDRLFEKKEQPEAFYNGRVFIEIYEPDWLPVEIPDHHIFDVKDGYFSGFSGDKILKNKRFRNLEEIMIFFDDAAGVYDVKGEVHV